MNTHMSPVKPIRIGLCTDLSGPYRPASGMATNGSPPCPASRPSPIDLSPTSFILGGRQGFGDEGCDES